MSKRKTVKLNFPVLLPLIKEAFRSNVVFCEKMGRPNQKTWVSDWVRNHNLPSPDEAVKMCELLNTTPEEILLEPDDIALVNELIEKKGIKKDLPQGEAELSAAKRALYAAIDELTDEQCDKLLGIVLEAKKIL